MLPLRTFTETIADDAGRLREAARMVDLNSGRTRPLPITVQARNVETLLRCGRVWQADLVAVTDVACDHAAQRAAADTVDDGDGWARRARALGWLLNAADGGPVDDPRSWLN